MTKAKAIYTYTGNSDEELPFAEGDMLDIVDKTDDSWWKAEKAGVVFIVPAAYLEVQGELSSLSFLKPPTSQSILTAFLPFPVHSSAR